MATDLAGYDSSGSICSSIVRAAYAPSDMERVTRPDRLMKSRYNVLTRDPCHLAAIRYSAKAICPSMVNFPLTAAAAVFG
jgi:hypothetical protein